MLKPWITMNIVSTMSRESQVSLETFKIIQGAPQICCSALWHLGTQFGNSRLSIVLTLLDSGMCLLVVKKEEEL